MTDEIPAVVATTIKALRTAAAWLPDEYRDMLYEAATVAENGGWEDACCPVCEETWCDAGCPLEGFRGEILRRAEAERHLNPPAKLTEQQIADFPWPRWTPFRRPVPIALDPPYQRPVLPGTCYDASFGRVHVRPGCRC